MQDESGSVSAKAAYTPVPVEAAREIAERYGKSIVIIFAHDPVHGLVHTTTYGRDPQEKAWAAQGGEIATRALGGITELATEFQDYRLEMAKTLLAALKDTLDSLRTLQAACALAGMPATVYAGLCGKAVEAIRLAEGAIDA